MTVYIVTAGDNAPGSRFVSVHATKEGAIAFALEEVCHRPYRTIPEGEAVVFAQQFEGEDLDWWRVAPHVVAA